MYFSPEHSALVNVWSLTIWRLLAVAINNLFVVEPHHFYLTEYYNSVASQKSSLMCGDWVVCAGGSSPLSSSLPPPEPTNVQNKTVRLSSLRWIISLLENFSYTSTRWWSDRKSICLWAEWGDVIIITVTWSPITPSPPPHISLYQ